MFTMPSPEDLAKLSLEEISALYEEAHAAAIELNKIPDDKITADEARELVQLINDLGTLHDRIEELETEAAGAAPTAEEIAAARAALIAPEESAEAGAEEGAEAGEEEGAEVDAEAGAEVKEKEAVLAGAARNAGRSFASRAQRNGGKQDTPPEPDPKLEAKSKALSIRAAANVRGFSVEQELSLDELAVAYANRAKMFAGGGRGSQTGRKARARAGTYGASHALSDSHQRFAVAKLQKPENEFTITEKMSAEDQFDLIRKAASEKRLGGGSLVAAGGWCAPSEQVWGFLELESADGLLSIPEVTARRGGISYTKGPQLGDLLIASDLGWVMSEAEVEAGTLEKPIYDIECPDWDEIRLKVTGYAIRAGLLTESAYPELLRRYLGLGLIVHARRMNKLTIDAISTIIGAATVFTPVGAQPSATADLLAAIELGAIRIREQYSMPLNSTVEGVFPLWALAVVRSDLSRRLGIDPSSGLSVPDSAIVQWFRDRKVSAQFVRDYQPINNGALNVAGGTDAWKAFPNKVQFMLYPAGSFVRLGTDVIDLDTVYDTDNLTKNQFLAAFFEEGFEVANTGGSGVKYEVGLPNLFGSVGYPGIGALANVAPTP